MAWHVLLKKRNPTKQLNDDDAIDRPLAANGTANGTGSGSLPGSVDKAENGTGSGSLPGSVDKAEPPCREPLPCRAGTLDYDT